MPSWRRSRTGPARHVKVVHGQVSFAGTCAVRAELDLADALDLEDALSREAATLAAAGCEESLDVRRSLALGVIARGEETLDLEPGESNPIAQSARSPCTCTCTRTRPPAGWRTTAG